MTKVALAALAALAIAGFMAVKLVAPAEAGNVSIVDLPGLGYSLGARVDGSTSPVCAAYWVMSGNGAPETLLGDFNDTSHPTCNTDPAVMQARIDSLLANYPPRPVPAATVTVTLPAETVTAPAVTVTAPAVTTTLPAVTTTLPAPPVQTVERIQTVALPAVTMPAVTTTVTDTTAVASLQARVTAQRAQIVRQKKLLAKRRR